MPELKVNDRVVDLRNGCTGIVVDVVFEHSCYGVEKFVNVKYDGHWDEDYSGWNREGRYELEDTCQK